MSIRPLYDRVVVRRLPAETTTQSGIVIPDNAAEKPSQGEVIAVGAGTVLDNGERRVLSVKVGERVLFTKYSGTEVSINGEKFLVMRESDILAVVEVDQNEEKAA